MTNTTVSTGKATANGSLCIGAVALSDGEVREWGHHPALLVGAHAL